MVSKAKTERALTLKQRSWLLHYLGDCHGNMVKAAMMAGYEGAYSALAKSGQTNLQNPAIQVAVEEHFRPLGITADRTIREIGIHAFNNNLADFEEWFAGEKTLAELREDGVPTQVVAKAKVTTRTTKDGDTETTRELGLRPVQPSLDKLMKVLNIGQRPEDDESATIPSIQNIFVKNLQVQLAQVMEKPYNPRLPAVAEVLRENGIDLDTEPARGDGPPGLDAEPPADRGQAGTAGPSGGE